ncbi:hypothetical protein KJ657_05555 [Patescibacteria group bacterium]|nr:hypothetical protein [Patescibacteria group bacterium]MBU1685358.1 hypothetical protein [Patescibacteria group bacterium]
MLTNFFLAILLIAMALGVMVSLDSATSFMVGFVKRVLRMTHRSKLLTEYILRAYIRYRRAINKPLIPNSY